MLPTVSSSSRTPPTPTKATGHPRMGQGKPSTGGRSSARMPVTSSPPYAAREGNAAIAGCMRYCTCSGTKEQLTG
eukprot:7568307-Pyramimonas_sp.AAC.1